MRLFSACVIALFLASAGFCQGPLASGGYLGISIRDLGPDDPKTLNAGTDRGTVITRVKLGGPADRAGLRANDVIVRFNGRLVSDSRDLVELTSETAPGRRVPVQYWRDGRLVTTAITTGTRPALDDAERSPIFNVLPTDIPAPLLVWRNTVLGTECEPLPPQLGAYFGVQNGVLVRYVVRGSLADTAGIRAGDVILQAGERRITNPRDLTSALQEMTRSGGKALTVTVLRDHKQLVFQVRLAD